MNTLKTGLMAAALIGLSSAALAIPLAPGGVVFPTGTTFAANPNLGGAVVNDNIIAFDFDPTPVTPFSNVGGELQNRVALSDNLNTAIFMPRIRNTYNIDGGTFAILGFSVTGYTGVDVDVDFRTDGLGDVGPTSVSRSADGDLMTVRFGTPIVADSVDPPGRQEESRFMSILTDSTDFDTSGIMTVFGEIIPLGSSTPSGNAANTFSFTIAGVAAPAAAVPPVPVPASMALFGTGLLAFGAMRIRKRKT